MKKTALLLSFMLMFAFSCKKSVDSEKKSWEYNLKKITKLSYEYPSFKSVLLQQQKDAEKVMNEASSISDEKAKIEKMSQANSMIRSGFVRNLEKISDIKESISKKSIKVRGMSMPYDKKMSVNQAIYAGERAVRTADEKLKSSVTNKNEAEALSSLALSGLKSAESNISSLIREVESLKKAEDKKKQEIEKTKVAAEKTKVEAAKPIKCPYCGTLNVATATKCKSCGAPISKK